MPTVDPSACLEGHVKRNPSTGDVAVRTAFPEDDYPDMAWTVVTSRSGATTKPSSYVDGWDDLFAEA